jgi:hypothetical protein
MNPCYIYWTNIERSKNIDISNKEEMEFVKDCVNKWYSQTLNLIKNNINKRLHKNLTIDYLSIINNYHDIDIIDPISKMTYEKYNLQLVINPFIIEILEILRQKLKEHEALQGILSITENEQQKYKEQIKKYRRRHKPIFSPVLSEFIEKRSPYLRELEKFKLETGYIEDTDEVKRLLRDSGKSRTRSRKKRKSKRRSKRKIYKY